jgi:hypothetical protein
MGSHASLNRSGLLPYLFIRAWVPCGASYVKVLLKPGTARTSDTIIVPAPGLLMP